MIKKLFKKYLPHPHLVTKNTWSGLLGSRLKDPSLWHINRKSCSGAIALGVFCAFIPLPAQMLIAAVFAVLLRYNILISVAMVWISNPITIPPMFYFCYLAGSAILGTEADNFSFELSFDWLIFGLLQVWQPLLLGCLLLGAVASLLSFLAVRILWRMRILAHLKIRRERRIKSEAS
ncbi:MAG: DUF2062 domain-containing protein [Proteobacteria bacterium]|nr:DUF2062 domain-containing protein [Pseudomonadota bacterium]